MSADATGRVTILPHQSDEELEAAIAHNRKLERLRITAREVARLSSDLTTLSFSVPTDDRAMVGKLGEIEQAVKRARLHLE